MDIVTDKGNPSSLTKQPLPMLRSSAKLPAIMIHETTQRNHIAQMVLLVIFVFQLVSLPGALLSHSNIQIGIVLLGLGLCGAAFLFQRAGMLTVVSVLLIAVVDLGCGLMLLTSSMGLDVMDLPVFDLLIISELITVSLLPAKSVFVVACANILFIIGDIFLQPHSMDLTMLLTSNMAYNSIMQPVLLQVIVAAISYIWVRSVIIAMARADRAEEIAELRRKEVEHAQALEGEIESLSQVLVAAANGMPSAYARLSQNNILWRVGNALNLLLTRVRRYSQAMQENAMLRHEIQRLSMALHEERSTSLQRHSSWLSSGHEKQTLY